MVAEIRSFTVTTPINTAKAAPLITPMAMPPRIVRKVEIRVPPGPNGELGFAIGMANQAIIPYNPGEWFVTSDEVVVWEFDVGLDSGAWQCQSYNTGAYPHTIQVRFYLDLIPNKGNANTVTLLDTDSLQPAPVTTDESSGPVTLA